MQCFDCRAAQAARKEDLISSQLAELLPRSCNTGCCLDALCAVAAAIQVQKLVGALQHVGAALIIQNSALLHDRCIEPMTTDVPSTSGKMATSNLTNKVCKVKSCNQQHKSQASVKELAV